MIISTCYYLSATSPPEEVSRAFNAFHDAVRAVLDGHVDGRNFDPNAFNANVFQFSGQTRERPKVLTIPALDPDEGAYIRQKEDSSGTVGGMEAVVDAGNATAGRFCIVDKDNLSQQLISLIPDDPASAASPGGTIKAPAGNLTLDAGATFNVIVNPDIHWKSGTAFLGKLEHANTADRRYTFPDLNVTIVGYGGGSGTVNRLPKFASTPGVLDDSGVEDDGSIVTLRSRDTLRWGVNDSRPALHATVYDTLPVLEALTADTGANTEFAAKNYWFWGSTGQLGLLDHANTSLRTYVFPNADVTVAGVTAGSGAANVLPRFGSTVGTLVDSGLSDNGSIISGANSRALSLFSAGGDRALHADPADATAAYWGLQAAGRVAWSSSTSAAGTKDLAIGRSAAGVLLLRDPSGGNTSPSLIFGSAGGKIETQAGDLTLAPSTTTTRIDTSAQSPVSGVVPELFAGIAAGATAHMLVGGNAARAAVIGSFNNGAGVVRLNVGTYVGGVPTITNRLSVWQNGDVTCGSAGQLGSSSATGSDTAPDVAWKRSAAGKWILLDPTAGNTTPMLIGNVANASNSALKFNGTTVEFKQGGDAAYAAAKGLTLEATTEVITPSVDSGAATDLLLQRNNATRLTIGDTAITGAVTFSSPGAGANSERYGASAVAAGSGAIAVGNTASAAGNASIAIGAGATAGTDYSLAFGWGSGTITAHSVVFGGNPDESGYFDNFIFGGNDEYNPAPTTVTLRPPNADQEPGNPNLTGDTDFIVAGACGTGTGAGGPITFKIAPAGASGSTLNALVEALKIYSTSAGIVFNESGADRDERHEGDTDANLWFLDASTDRVGVGTGSPGTKLDVNGVLTLSLNDGSKQIRGPTAGPLYVQAGTPTGTANGRELYLNGTDASTSGVGGHVYVNTGAGVGSGNNGGDIVMTPGASGGGAGRAGLVDFHYAGTAAGTNAPTMINVPGTGAAAQTEWLKVLINGNVRYIPVWS